MRGADAFGGLGPSLLVGGSWDHTSTGPTSGRRLQIGGADGFGGELGHT